MAKIDVTRIEGYESMTPEQRITALESYDFPDPDYSGFVDKKVFDTTASELAALKKKNKEMLSEEERRAQEAADELERMKVELADVKKRETIADYKAKFIAQGYPEDLASATAQAMADGDTSTVFANQQKFLTDFENKVKADVLKSTPTPPAGSGNGQVDYAKKIDEAQAANDLTAVAYYTRLQAQAAAQPNKT